MRSSSLMVSNGSVTYITSFGGYFGRNYEGVNDFYNNEREKNGKQN